MSRLRTALLGLASAAALLGPGASSAASFQVWDGAISNWSNNGITHFTGPTTASYVGISLPCNADFTVEVINGSAQVIAAAFTGSTACAGIVAYLPWPVTAAATPYTGPNPPFAGAPTLTPVLWNVSVGNVKIHLPPPINVTCPSVGSPGGTVTGVLDVADQAGAPPAAPMPNRYVFKQNLGPCLVQTRTNAFPNSLVANPAVKIIP